MRGASAERAMCFVVHVVVCSEGGAPVDSLTCGGHGVALGQGVTAGCHVKDDVTKEWVYRYV